ncbi:MAG: SDR family oxidoreductase [Chitinophagaceae bacterium]|nr:SDR family oxidoreductase [Chitinophagaceae bacterium]
MSVALILGATSDIGKAIARKFAENKYQVLLACRNTAALSTFVSDMNIRYGIPCHSYSFDATDFSSHEKFYNDLPLKPDVVICVFGYMNDNEATIASQVETLKTINTNYTGAVTILNIIAADFAGRKQGVIAGISSVAGERGRQSNYIYGSAKAGFTAYLSGLRNKLYKSNVHVLTILPGFVFTKMTEHLNLQKLLTATPENVADSVYNAVKKRKNIVYIKWFWKWIMFIIKSIPESIFKKKEL